MPGQHCSTSQGVVGARAATCRVTIQSGRKKSVRARLSATSSLGNPYESVPVE